MDEPLGVTAGAGTRDCKRKLKLKGNRFELRGEERTCACLGCLGYKERLFVLVADRAGLGQASLGTSRKYFHCLIPGHQTDIRQISHIGCFHGLIDVDLISTKFILCFIFNEHQARLRVGEQQAELLVVFLVVVHLKNKRLINERYLIVALLSAPQPEQYNRY